MRFVGSRFEFRSPDFVVVGIPHGAGVAIFASDNLLEVELRAVANDDVCFSEIERGAPTLKWIEVNGRMRTLLYVVGATYAECFESLAKRWNPDASRPSVAPARRALSGRSSGEG